MRIRELAMALRSGELSPSEHVADVLDRLAADAASPTGTNAVVVLDSVRAAEEAAARGAEIARGCWRGPLHGVAVGIKDLVDVAGLPTRAGSHVLDAAAPALADAPIVTALRRAGAVVVAKLHTHEFAYGPTGDVAATGPTRNPHDPSRITGGSSSGSAAAVAAGHLPLAIGTDTGCSVRTPAALCGIVGLKPSFDRLPTGGVFPLAESCDHVGLLTADVHGAAVAYDALVREGGGAGIQAPGVEGVRIGVPGDGYWAPLDPVIADGVAAALDRLARQGAELVEVSTAMVEELAATYPLIVGSEALATHGRWLAECPDRYQPATRRRLERMADLPARGYVTAQRTRRRLAAAMRAALDGVDALVLPTTRLRATPIGESHVDGVTVASALLDLNLPFNLTGWPAVSVPAAVDGLPAGVQVVGVGLEERGVLRVAAALAG